VEARAVAPSVAAAAIATREFLKAFMFIFSEGNVEPWRRDQREDHRTPTNA
jgi:hypothetical protein